MTDRQERVLNAVMNEINIEDLGDISSLIQEFLPYVTHNITQIKAAVTDKRSAFYDGL